MTHSPRIGSTVTEKIFLLINGWGWSGKELICGPCDCGAFTWHYVAVFWLTVYHP